MQVIKVDIEKIGVNMCAKINHLCNTLSKEEGLALPMEKLHYEVEGLLFEARNEGKLFVNTQTPMQKCEETKLYYVIFEDKKYYFVKDSTGMIYGRVKSHQKGYEHCYEFEKD